jgi:hypothetical protein
MDHRRHLPVIGGEEARIDREHAFLELPEAPHRNVRVQLAVASLDGDGPGQVEHGPEIADPRAGADDHVVAFDPALVGQHRGDRAAVVPCGRSAMR